MQMVAIQYYESPCGTLLLGALEGRLCLCDWCEAPHHDAILRRVSTLLASPRTATCSSTLDAARQQLDEYFHLQRDSFTIPLLPVGTEFQQSVWAALAEIPYGTTCSYADLACAVGRPDTVRAVANAVGANALSLFLPCHRVIASGGGMGGYAGGLAAKRYLLQLEQQRVVEK
ncbi:MAG: methylated-DNA--[protein]-cysteine S-methyltransferase [Bacteroidales bacterium]|nr:methylated-DNA--[protein]-cysteine S-methyltransferase [Bacteroidales bacterium]